MKARYLTMTISADVLQALLVYLGGAPLSPEVDPIGADERLRAHSGSTFDMMKQACTDILDELMHDDQSWRLDALNLVGAAAATRMQALHPELSAILARKLGNWYSFRWR